MSVFNFDVYFLFNEKTKAHSAFANCRAGETWQIPIWFELVCVCVCVCAHGRRHRASAETKGSGNVSNTSCGFP